MDYRTGLSPLRSSLGSGISSPRLPTKNLPPAPRIPGNASRRRGRGRRNTGSEAGPPGAGLREPCARERRGPGSARGRAARGSPHGDAGPLAGLGVARIGEHGGSAKSQLGLGRGDASQTLRVPGPLRAHKGPQPASRSFLTCARRPTSDPQRHREKPCAAPGKD